MIRYDMYMMNLNRVFFVKQGDLVLCAQQLSDGSVGKPRRSSRRADMSRLSLSQHKIALVEMPPRSSCYKETTFEHHHMDVWTRPQYCVHVFADGRSDATVTQLSRCVGFVACQRPCGPMPKCIQWPTFRYIPTWLANASTSQICTKQRARY